MAGKTAKTGRKVEKMRGNHSAAAPQSQKHWGKTPESPKIPLQLGCSVTQIRHFFKRTFFNLPLIFENNVKKATVWLHQGGKTYRFRKASPLGRGVTGGDGEGKPVKAGRRHSDRQALCQSDGIAVWSPCREHPCPLRRSRASSPKGRAFFKMRFPCWKPPAPLLHRSRRKPLPPLRPRWKRCSRLRPPKRLRRSRRRCQRRSRRPRW